MLEGQLPRVIYHRFFSVYDDKITLQASGFTRDFCSGFLRDLGSRFHQRPAALVPRARCTTSGSRVAGVRVAHPEGEDVRFVKDDFQKTPRKRFQKGQNLSRTEVPARFWFRVTGFGWRTQKERTYWVSRERPPLATRTPSVPLPWSHAPPPAVGLGFRV